MADLPVGGETSFRLRGNRAPKVLAGEPRRDGKRCIEWEVLWFSIPWLQTGMDMPAAQATVNCLSGLEWTVRREKARGSFDLRGVET